MRSYRRKGCSNKVQPTTPPSLSKVNHPHPSNPGSASLYGGGRDGPSSVNARRIPERPKPGGLISMKAAMAAATVTMLWLQGSRGGGSCRSCFIATSKLLRLPGSALPSLKTCCFRPVKGRYWVAPGRSMSRSSQSDENVNADREMNGNEMTEKFLNKKIRVDELLLELGLASDMKVFNASVRSSFCNSSIQHAGALVLAGAVIIDETVRVTSPAQKVRRSTPIRLKAQKVVAPCTIPAL